jgi:hypothetical protein
MEIVIEGTHKGHRRLSPGQATFIDANADNNHDAAIGQYAYLIAYRVDDYIIGKYRVVEDGRGRVGFLAYLLYFSYKECLQGLKVLDLFERIEQYFATNLVNNDLVVINNDWGYLEKLQEEYSQYLSPNPYNYSKIKRNAKFSFSYYDHTQALVDIFDNLFQPKFSEYKGVYLVDRLLKNSIENPLNALGHDSEADLTSLFRVDIKKYKFKNNSNPSRSLLKLSVLVNNKPIGLDGTITDKDFLAIEFSLPNHQSQVFSGFLESMELNQILRINEDLKELCIEENIGLKPLSRVVRIVCIDENNNSHENLRIKCYNKKNGNYKKQVNTYAFEITGQELNETWVFEVPEDKYFDKSSTSWSNGDGDSVKIELQPKKKIHFEIIDTKSNKPVNDCEIFVNDQLINGLDYFVSKNKIHSTVKLEVRKKNYLNAKIDRFRLNGNPEIELTPYEDIETPPILKVLLVFMVMVAGCLAFILFKYKHDIWGPAEEPFSTSVQTPIKEGVDVKDKNNTNSTTSGNGDKKQPTAQQTGGKDTVQAPSSPPTTPSAGTTAVTSGNKSNQLSKDICNEAYNKELEIITNNKNATRQNYIDLEKGFAKCASCIDKLRKILNDENWSNFDVANSESNYNDLKCN